MIIQSDDEDDCCNTGGCVGGGGGPILLLVEEEGSACACDGATPYAGGNPPSELPNAPPVENALYGSAVKNPLAAPEEDTPGGEDELELLEMGVKSDKSLELLPLCGDGLSLDV